MASINKSENSGLVDMSSVHNSLYKTIEEKNDKSSPMTKSKKIPPPVMPKPKFFHLKTPIDQTMDEDIEFKAKRLHTYSTDSQSLYKQSYISPESKTSGNEKPAACGDVTLDVAQSACTHHEELKKSDENEINCLHPVLLPNNNGVQTAVHGKGMDCDSIESKVFDGEFPKTTGAAYECSGNSQVLKKSCELNGTQSTAAIRTVEATLAKEDLSNSLSKLSNEPNSLSKLSNEEKRNTEHEEICRPKRAREMAKWLENFFQTRPFPCPSIGDSKKVKDTCTREDNVDNLVASIGTQGTQRYRKPLPFLGEIKKHSTERLVDTHKEVTNPLMMNKICSLQQNYSVHIGNGEGNESVKLKDDCTTENISDPLISHSRTVYARRNLKPLPFLNEIRNWSKKRRNKDNHDTENPSLNRDGSKVDTPRPSSSELEKSEHKQHSCSSSETLFYNNQQKIGTVPVFPKQILSTIVTNNNLYSKQHSASSRNATLFTHPVTVITQNHQPFICQRSLIPRKKAKRMLRTVRLNTSKISYESSYTDLYDKMGSSKILANQCISSYLQIPVASPKKPSFISERLCKISSHVLKGQDSWTETGIANSKTLELCSSLKVSTGGNDKNCQLPNTFTSLIQKSREVTSSRTFYSQISRTFLILSDSVLNMLFTKIFEVLSVNHCPVNVNRLTVQSSSSSEFLQSFLHFTSKLYQDIPMLMSTYGNYELPLVPYTDAENILLLLNSSSLALIMSNNALSGEDNSTDSNVQIVQTRESKQPHIPFACMSLKADIKRFSGVKWVTSATGTRLNQGKLAPFSKENKQIYDTVTDNKATNALQSTEQIDDAQLSKTTRTFSCGISPLFHCNDTENTNMDSCLSNYLLVCHGAYKKSTSKLQRSQNSPFEDFDKSNHLKCSCISESVLTSKTHSKEMCINDSFMPSTFSRKDTYLHTNENPFTSKGSEVKDFCTSCLYTSSHSPMNNLVDSPLSVNDSFHSLSSQLSSSASFKTSQTGSDVSEVDVPQKSEKKGSPYCAEAGINTNFAKIDGENRNVVHISHHSEQNFSDCDRNKYKWHEKQNLEESQMAECSQPSNMKKEKRKCSIANNNVSKTCSIFEALSKLRSTIRFSQDTDKTSSFSSQKVNSVQAHTKFDREKCQERAYLENNVQEWLSSVTTFENKSLSDQLMIDSKKNRKPNPELVNLATSLPRADSNCLSAKTNGIKSSENDFSLQVDTKTDTSCHEPKFKLKEDHANSIAHETSSSETDTFSSACSHPDSVLAPEIKEDSSDSVIGSNVANSLSDDLVLQNKRRSSLSDFKSSISLDTVSAFQTNIPSSGSDSFYSTESNEGLYFVDKFIPLSKMKQDALQSQIAHKSPTPTGMQLCGHEAAKSISRSEAKMYVPDPEVLEQLKLVMQHMSETYNVIGHFLQEVLRRSDTKLCDFLNNWRLTPGSVDIIDRKSTVVSPKVSKQPDTSCVQPALGKETCTSTSPTGSVFPSNKRSRSSEVKFYNAFLETEATKTMQAMKLRDLDSPVRSKKLPTIYALGRNTPGGNNQNAQLFQGHHDENNGKELPDSVESLTILSVMAVSQNGLLTSDVPMQAGCTADDKVSCCAVLSHADDVRLDMPPYQSSVAALSDSDSKDPPVSCWQRDFGCDACKTRCELFPLTCVNEKNIGVDYSVQGVDKLTSETVPEVCVPIVDGIRDYIYLYRIPSKTKEKVDNCYHHTGQKCLHHNRDKNSMNIADKPSVVSERVAAEPRCDFLDPSAILLKGTKKTCVADITEIHSVSPSDKEVACIMCKTLSHSPERTQSWASRYIDGDVLFPDRATQTICKAKRSCTPYPFLSTKIFKKTQVNENSCVEFDSSIPYEVSTKEFCISQSTEEAHSTAADNASNLASDGVRSSEQQNSRSNLLPPLSSALKYNKLAKALDDAMTETGLENQSETAFLLKVERILNQIDKEYGNLSFLNDLEDFSCQSRTSFTESKSVCSQNQMSQALFKSNEKRTGAILYSTNTDDCIYSNTKTKRIILIHMLKNISECLKKISEEEMVNKKKQSIKCQSKNTSSQGTAWLPQSNSNYYRTCIKPSNSVHETNATAITRKNLKVLLTQVFKIIHMLKLQGKDWNWSSQPVSAESFAFRTDSQLNAYHKYTLPWQSKTKNFEKFNTEVGDCVPFSNIDTFNENSKNCNSKENYENDAKYCTDSLRKPTFGSNRYEQTASFQKSIRQNMQSNDDNKNVVNGSCDKGKLPGKIEIMCRYLEIPTEDLENFFSNEIWPSGLSEKTTSSVSLFLNIGSWSDSESNEHEFAIPSVTDNMNTSDFKRNISDTAVDLTKNSIYEGTDRVPLVTDTTAKVERKSATNILAKYRLQSKMNHIKTSTDSSTYALTKRNKSQKKCKKADRQQNSLPLGISSYTILQHPAWKEFNDIDSATQINRSLQELENITSSDSNRTRKTTLASKMKTNVVQEGTIDCLHKGVNNKPALLLKRKCGLQHSFPGVARIESMKYHSPTESIVCTLGPPRSTHVLQYPQISTGLLSKENMNQHNQQEIRENQRPLNISFRTPSKTRDSEKLCKNGIISTNTVESPHNIIRGIKTLRTVSDHEPGVCQYRKCCMSTNSRGAKGYSLQKVDNKSIWNNHSIVRNSCPKLKYKNQVHSYNNTDVTHSDNYSLSFHNKNTHTELANITTDDNNIVALDCLTTPDIQKMSSSTNDKSANAGCHLPDLEDKEYWNTQNWPTQQYVDLLNRVNALPDPIFKVFDTVDSVNQKSHIFSDRDAKNPAKTQTIFQCRKKNRQKYCGPGLNISVINVPDGVYSEQADKSNMIGSFPTTDGLSGFFQNILYHSEPGNIYKNELQWNQQSYVYSLHEPDNFKYFSQMSTNQNAADSPPRVSDDNQAAKNQPTFSKFMHGHSASPFIKVPQATVEKQSHTLENQGATTESLMLSNTSSVSSGQSSCSSREKLSVTDKINFFTKKINTLTKRPPYQAPPAVQTLKTTPVRSMLQKYQSAIKINTGSTVAQKGTHQHNDVHQHSSNFYCTMNTTKDYGVTPNNTEDDNHSSFDLKGQGPHDQQIIKSKYCQGEDGHFSREKDILPAAGGVTLTTKASQTTVSDTSRQDNQQSGLKSQNSPKSIRLVCCSAENVHKTGCSVHVKPKICKLPKLDTYLSCTDHHNVDKIPKQRTLRKHKQYSSINNITSCTSCRPPVHDTGHIPSEKPNINPNDIGKIGKLAMPQSQLELTTMKDDLAHTEFHSVKEIGARLLRTNNLNLSRKQLQQLPDHTHSKSTIQNKEKTDDQSNSTQSALITSEIPHKIVSKPLTPRVNKMQSVTKKQMYQKERRCKSCNSEPFGNKQDISWKRMQHLRTRYLLFDSFEKQKGMKHTQSVRDQMQMDKSHVKPDSDIIPKDPGVMLLGNFDILKNSCSQDVSLTSPSDQEECSSGLSDCIMASDSKSITIPSLATESSQYASASTASSDNYTTASESEEGTTSELVQKDIKVKNRQSPGTDYSLSFEDNPQFDRAYGPKETYSTTRTITDPVTIKSKNVYKDRSHGNDRPSACVYSQGIKKDILNKIDSNFCIKRNSTRSFAFDKYKYDLNEHTRARSDMNSCHKNRQQFQLQRTKYKQNKSPKKYTTFCDNRILNCQENIKDKLKPSVPHTCKCDSEEKPASEISSEINLSKSTIAVSQPPLLNLPKCLGRLTRFFKDPDSNVNILTAKADACRKQYFTFTNFVKDKTGPLKKENKVFRSPKSNHQLSKAIIRDDKHKNLTGDQSAKKQKQVQRDTLGVPFCSPVNEQTKTVASSACYPPNMNTKLIYEKRHDSHGCSDILKKQGKEPRHYKSDTTKSTSKLKRTHKSHKKCENVPVKFFEKRNIQHNIEDTHESRNRCTQFTTEVLCEDAFPQRKVKDTPKHELKAVSANFSKNARDDVECQQIPDFDDLYQTPCEEDFELSDFVPWSSEKNEHKIICMENGNPNEGERNDMTLDQVSAKQMLESATFNQEQEVVRHFYDCSIKTDKYQLQQLSSYESFSSSAESYATNTRNVHNLNRTRLTKVVSEPFVREKKTFKINAPRSRLSNSPKPTQNFPQHSVSNSYALISHSERLITGNKQDSSYKSVRQGALLPSQADGLISDIKRKPEAIENDFNYYTTDEFVDLEEQTQNTHWKAYTNEIICDETKTADVILVGTPKKETYCDEDSKTGISINRTQSLKSENQRHENQEGKLKTFQKPEIKEPPVETTTVISTSFENKELSEESKMKKISQYEAIKDVNKAEKPSASNEKIQIIHKTQKVNEQKPTDNEKCEDKDKAIVDSEKNTKLNHSDKEERQNKMFESAQHTSRSEACRHETFHTPIAKIEILKPGSNVEIVTTVHSSPSACRGECFYSPKNESTNVDNADLKTPWEKYSFTEKMTTYNENQDVFVERKVKSIVRQILDHCSSLAKNALNIQNTEEHKSSLTEVPAVHIHTRSVNFMPGNFVTQQTIPKASKHEQKESTLSYHDPYTMPGKVRKSKTSYNITLTPSYEKEMGNDISKSVRTDEKVGLLRRNGRSVEQKLHKTACNHLPTEQHSGERNDRLKKEDKFMSAGMLSQFSDVHEEGPIINLSKHGNGCKFGGNTCGYTNSAFQRNKQFLATNNISLTGNRTHCPKLSVSNMKKSVSQKCPSNKPESFPSDVETNFDNSSPYKECYSRTCSPNFPQKTHVYCTSSNSCNPMVSPSLPSDTIVGLPKKKMTQKKLRLAPENYRDIFSPGALPNDNIKISQTHKRSHCSQHMDDHKIHIPSSAFPSHMNSFSITHPRASFRCCNLKHPFNSFNVSSEKRDRDSSRDYPFSKNGRNSKENAAMYHQVKRGVYWKSDQLQSDKRVFSTEDIGINSNCFSICDSGYSKVKSLPTNYRIRDEWCKDKDSNSNKKPTRFKITTESSGEKNTAPSFKIEVSPSSGESSDEPPVTRRVKVHKMQPSNHHGKFVMTEIKRHKKIFKNALQHTFPPCAYKSKTKVHGDPTISIKTGSSRDEPSLSTTSQSTTSDDKTTVSGKERKSISPGDTTQITVHTKSPPKEVKPSSPRSYEISATISNSGWPPPQKETTFTTDYAESIALGGGNSCIGVSSSVSQVTTQVRSPFPSSKFHGNKKDIRRNRKDIHGSRKDTHDMPQCLQSKVGRKTPTSHSKMSPKRLGDDIRHSSGGKPVKLAQSVSSVSLLPCAAKTRIALSAPRCPRCCSRRQLYTTFTKGHMSSDSAMDMMADALQNLKENPPRENQQTCQKRGIPNFRLARKSGCSIVSAVPSFESVQSDHQLTTTRSFTLKRNTSIKRLCSFKEESERRLRQARRSLRVQEMLIRLVGKTQAVLTNAMFTTRREIVDEKNRMRQKQTQIAMKIASLKRILQNPADASSSSSTCTHENFHHLCSAGTLSNAGKYCSRQVLSRTRVSTNYSNPDLMSVHLVPSDEAFNCHNLRQNQGYPKSSVTTSVSHNIVSGTTLQPIIDELCVPCLQAELNRPLSRQQKFHSPSYSTQSCNLHHHKRSHLHYSTSVPSVTSLCHRNRLCIHRVPHYSKSDSSISYTSADNLAAENQESSCQSRKIILQRTHETPWCNTGASVPGCRDHKRKMCNRHWLCPQKCNWNESKKSIATNKTIPSTRLLHIHEKYFERLQQLARKVAFDATRDVSRYRLKMRNPSQSLGCSELQTETRYLLNLEDISRMVSSLCMNAINQGITTEWKNFCSVFLQPKERHTITTAHTNSDRLNPFSETGYHCGNIPVRSSQGFLCCTLSPAKRVRLSEDRCREHGRLGTLEPKCGERVFETLSNVATRQHAKLYDEVSLEEGNTQRKPAAPLSMDHRCKGTYRGCHHTDKVQCQSNVDFSRSDSAVKATEVKSFNFDSQQELYPKPDKAVIRNRYPQKIHSETTDYASCYSLTENPNDLWLTNNNDQSLKEKFLSESIISHCSKHPKDKSDHVSFSYHRPNRSSIPYDYKATNRRQNLTCLPDIKTDYSNGNHNDWTCFNQRSLDRMCLIEQYQESIEKLSSSHSFGSVESRKETRSSKIFISTLPEESQKTLRYLQHQRSQTHNRHKDKFARLQSHECWNKRSDSDHHNRPATERFFNTKCGRPDHHGPQRNAAVSNDDISDIPKNLFERQDCRHRFPTTQKRISARPHQHITTSNKGKHSTCPLDTAAANYTAKCSHKRLNAEGHPLAHKDLSCLSRHYILESEVNSPSHIHIDIKHSYQSSPHFKQTSKICRKNRSFLSQTAYGGNHHHTRRDQKSKTKYQQSQPEYTIKKKDIDKSFSCDPNWPKPSHPKHNHEKSARNIQTENSQTSRPLFCKTNHHRQTRPYEHSHFQQSGNADTLPTNYPETTCGVHQSLSPYNARADPPQQTAAREDRHHTRPRLRHHTRPNCETEDKLPSQNRAVTLHGLHTTRSSSRRVSASAYPSTHLNDHHHDLHEQRSKALKNEIQQRVAKNMKRLAKNHPQDVCRMSYQQLLRANDQVMTSLQCSLPLDADSLNRTFRKAVYHSFLQIHQPDICL